MTKTKIFGITRLRHIVLCLLLSICLSFTGIAHAQIFKTNPLTPEQIQNNILKTGLLYNFIKYTTWPEHGGTKKDVLTVCLLGGGPFSGYLMPLEGRTANAKKIDIIEAQTKEDTAGCNVVFVNTNQKKDIAEIIEYFNGREILTVSDLAYFTEMGGMVEFSMKLDRRIHVYINDDALDANMLMVDDRLVRLSDMEDKK